MAWYEITLNMDHPQLDGAVNALTAAGFSDLQVEDQQEMEAFLEENRSYWDYIDESLQEALQGLCRVKLYLEDTDEDGLSRLKGLARKLELTPEITALPDTDWETSWQENYPPQPVGETLVVLPVWLADRDPEGRIPVILDPGLTFGTGAHPSTQMVMEAMEALGLRGKTCLDLGSGSGILSITALALGAKEATGVDIDPKAEDIARENAASNGFTSPHFTALTGNVLADGKLMASLESRSWDLVLVNIVADVIIGLCPVLPRFLGEKSRLILSGILDSRLGDVENALKTAGLKTVNRRARDEWRCLEVSL